MASGMFVRQEADTSALEEAGWKPPTPITVKADDGETDLYVRAAPEFAAGSLCGPERPRQNDAGREMAAASHQPL
eukprot:COSAG04_NODE_20305_length_396_cov_1.212121_1_plen_74_part_10